MKVCVELAQADGDAPGESAVPVSVSENSVLLAGRTVWSWPGLMGTHQMNLWSRRGQTEKQIATVTMKKRFCSLGALRGAGSG